MTYSVLDSRVIVSCRDKRTRFFVEGGYVAAFATFGRQAQKRLAMLQAATSVQDLRATPSSHLEALQGDRRGQWSIRINLKWRICFEWPSGAPGPSQIEIVYYH